MFCKNIANRNSLNLNAPALPNKEKNSISDLIQIFSDMKAPSSKISVEIPTFGIGYMRPSRASSTVVGSPANGLASFAFTDTFRLDAKMSYYRPYMYNQPTLCRILNDPSWIKQYDTQYEAPYAFNANTWVTYDNNESLEAKVTQQ